MAATGGGGMLGALGAAAGACSAASDAAPDAASASDATVGSDSVPQAPQNRASRGMSAPQVGQRRVCGALMLSSIWLSSILLLAWLSPWLTPASGVRLTTRD